VLFYDVSTTPLVLLLIVFFVVLQDIARQVFQIIDVNLPRVKKTFLFGNTTVISDSRFHKDDLLVVKDKAIGIMVASKDPGATLMINNVVILGICLPVAPIEPDFPSGVIHTSLYNRSFGKGPNSFCSGKFSLGDWCPLHVWRSPCHF
jgi:hypothetical protein